VRYGDGIRADSDGYLRARTLGEGVRRSDKPVRTYSPDRRCCCGTRLSIYNPDEHCARCEPERWAEH
jgi:hypothetical protein